MTGDIEKSGETSYVALDLFQPPTAHRELFTGALNRIVDKVESLIPVFGLRNPRISVPGTYKYAFCTADEWVASFWSGQLWLAYSLTGGDRFKNSARMRREYLKTVLENPVWHDHDLGFLFILTCVADYKLTGNADSRAMALRAADFLAARWRQPLPFVMCWNPQARDKDEFAQRKVGTLNIDSMQGMPLLYWAARETGQSSFREIADLHLNTCMEYLVRDDYSSYHSYEFDPRTGEPVAGYTHQGYSDESCWSRGQAWAIHALAQCYLATGNDAYRTTAAAMADYVAKRLPADGVPLWDYDLPGDEKPYRDTSAAATTAAGIYTLAHCYAGQELAADLTQTADKILHGLVVNHDITQQEGAEGFLNEGAAFVRLGRADNMLPYGDYYYMEAVMRSVGHVDFPW
jgi:unsaturated chondroitin disaccharide hydrolase